MSKDTKPSKTSSQKRSAQKPKGLQKNMNKNRTSDTVIHKDSWLWHGVVDLSLEAAAFPVPAKPGERQFDVSVQVSMATAQQSGQTQLLMRLIGHVQAHGQLVTLMDMLYSGVVEKQITTAELEIYAEELYVVARPAAMNALELVGHKPPMPQTLAEIPK